MADVKVYTTKACGYCVVAKKLLQKRGIPFDEIDVTQDRETRGWLVKETGRRTVPQIFIHGKPIGGADELCALDEAGELRKLIEALPASPSQ